MKYCFKYKNYLVLAFTLLQIPWKEGAYQAGERFTVEFNGWSEVTGLVKANILDCYMKLS